MNQTSAAHEAPEHPAGVASGALTRVRGTRWESNRVQTAGTAAGQAGFMCVVLAAIDMLNQKPELGFSLPRRWRWSNG